MNLRPLGPESPSETSQLVASLHTEAHPLGFPGSVPGTTAHVVTSRPTARTARTAPALRLPEMSPPLFIAAGMTVAALWPAQAAVLLARAQLQAALTSE